MTKAILFKKGDAGEVSHWRSLLIKKMEALGCGYKFIEERNFNLHEKWTAHVTVDDFTFDRKPRIEIGYEIDKKDNLLLTPVVLHELGHVVDYKEYNSMENYWRHYGTLDMEVRAWENAFKLAQELSFPHIKEMLKLAVYCVGHYYSNYESFGKKADERYRFKGESPSRSQAMERVYQASGLL